MIDISSDASLAPWLRRLAAYLYVSDLAAGKRVLEVQCGSGLGAQFLASRGAGPVIGIDSDLGLIEEARARRRLTNLEFRCEQPVAIELEDGSIDCVFVAEGAGLLRRRSVLKELRRVLAPGGHLVLCAVSADRPGGRGGVSYHECIDRLGELFAPVRMVAQSPLPAMTLVQYGGGDGPVELELDASLLALGSGTEPEVTDYVAICGGDRERDRLRELRIVELPQLQGTAALQMALQARSDGRGRGDTAFRAFADAKRRAEDLARRVAELEEQLAAASAAGGSGEGAAEETEDDQPTARWDTPDRALSVSERLADALAAHERELADKVAAIEEREAYADELRDELEHVRQECARLSDRCRQTELRVTDLEGELAGWRTRASLAEGEVLRLRTERAQGQAGSVQAAEGERDELRRQLAELEGQLAEARTKLERATENWQKAEAKNDDVWRRVGELQRELEQNREDTVTNASRQRQAAQVALTRAMEEASKKLVSVKDQLIRAERERNELGTRLGEAQRRIAELEAERAASPVPAAPAAPPQEDARLGELARNLEESESMRAELEDRLAELEARREELERALDERPARRPEEPLDTGAVLRACDRLRLIEGELASQQSLVGRLEDELSTLVQALGGGMIESTSSEASALASELGARDAEAIMLHVGVCALRDRVREILGMVQDARTAMAGCSAGEMLALMDTLSRRLTVYERV
jgi:SAM-dependent methyltransferase